MLSPTTVTRVIRMAYLINASAVTGSAAHAKPCSGVVLHEQGGL